MHVPESFSPSREEAQKWLRDALNHLYDIGYLENHPLGDLLVRPEQSTGKRGPDLRRVLISAIQARKPARGTPLQSPDWRGYQILEQHILSGLNPAEVMQSLNISRSLFFLEKTRILKVLFDDLWIQRVTATALSIDAPGDAAAPERSEAAQLLEHAIFGAVEIHSLLDSLRPLIEPLAQSLNTQVAIHSSGSTLIPHGERVLLRQVLLSLITELLQLTAGGQINIFTFEEAESAGIQIEAHRSSTERLEMRLEERRGLQPETGYEIIRATNGELTISVDAAGNYRAVASWVKEQTPKKLLLIDDHPDVADLFARHMAGAGLGSIWEIVWAASAENARQILAEQRPALIVLDVILPLEDGWEFLMALKADARTREIPVVVCSGINEPDLVRSLGAQGYLPKPFTAAQLIQALSHWADGLTPTLATKP